MSKDFFIMMNHPNGEIMPMEETANDVDDKVSLFDTRQEAKKIAKDHSFCQAYGYEIFERGTGEQ